MRLAVLAPRAARVDHEVGLLVEHEARPHGEARDAARHLLGELARLLLLCALVRVRVRVTVTVRVRVTLTLTLTWQKGTKPESLFFLADLPLMFSPLPTPTWLGLGLGFGLGLGLGLGLGPP